MRTALLVLTPWLWRKTMISRICIPSCQAVAIRSRRFGPMPSMDSKSAGLSLMTPSTSAPKCPTSFFAKTGPTPFTKPPARYRSTPSLVVGGTAFKTWALNWRPCSLSRTHHPFAVSHSPALTDGNEPRIVTSSRCPRTFTRSTANPLSSLKKVTRSTRPAISSEGVRGCGEESLILIEVYAVGADSSSANRCMSRSRSVYRARLIGGYTFAEHGGEAIDRLFAERDTKREESCARRANLRANDFRCFPHLFPDPNRRCIHIKQSHLLAAFFPPAINIDFLPRAFFFTLSSVRSNADGWRIFDVMHVLRVLRNDLIVQGWR